MLAEEVKKIINKQLKLDIPLEVPPDRKLGDFAFACFT